MFDNYYIYYAAWLLWYNYRRAFGSICRHEYEGLSFVKDRMLVFSRQLSACFVFLYTALDSGASVKVRWILRFRTVDFDEIGFVDQFQKTLAFLVICLSLLVSTAPDAGQLERMPKIVKRFSGKMRIKTDSWDAPIWFNQIETRYKWVSLVPRKSFLSIPIGELPTSMSGRIQE